MRGGVGLLSVAAVARAQVVRWSDVSAPFDRCALRISLFEGRPPPPPRHHGDMRSLNNRASAWGEVTGVDGMCLQQKYIHKCARPRGAVQASRPS